MNLLIAAIIIAILSGSTFGFGSLPARGGTKVASQSGVTRAGNLLMGSSSIESAYKWIDKLADSIPVEDKTRVRLHVRGGSVSSAVFRAEMKKELTFYYRCGAKFTTPYQGNFDEAEIIAEGKTASLKRFIGIWLKGVCSPMEVRKPNFQGPPLVVEVIEGIWEPIKDEFKSGQFLTASEPPAIGTSGGQEVSSRMGSDESV